MSKGITLSKLETDELLHIHKNQPVMDGDTLAASSKRSLLRLRLISNIIGHNVTTILGDALVEEIEHNRKS